MRIFDVACRSTASRASSRDIPVSVVPDAQPADSPAVDLDVDPARSGIEGVLHQLLDRGGGPRDDLAGRDSVDGARIESRGSKT